jgi:thioredoxin reductase (NADPH)
MSRYLAQRIRGDPHIEVHTNCELRDLLGDKALDAVVIEERDTGGRREEQARAVFVFIGAEPHTAWLGGQVALDDDGFVVTGLDWPHDDGETPGWPLDRAQYPLETSCPGVFAAGDVRSGAVRRVASAVGEGAMAVRFIHQYLADVGAASPARGVAGPAAGSRALTPGPR